MTIVVLDVPLSAGSARTVVLDIALRARCSALLPRMASGGVAIADEMLDVYVRQLLESHRTPEVTIAWQGGESE